MTDEDRNGCDDLYIFWFLMEFGFLENGIRFSIVPVGYNFENDPGAKDCFKYLEFKTIIEKHLHSKGLKLIFFPSSTKEPEESLNVEALTDLDEEEIEKSLRHLVGALLCRGIHRDSMIRVIADLGVCFGRVRDMILDESKWFEPTIIF